MSIEVLDRSACRRLLEEMPVGWLAHCTPDGVHMVPVNVALHENELVIHTTYGTTLDAVAAGLPLTFGTGAFDVEDRTGWSVTVTGVARMLGEPLVNPGLPAPDVWADLPQTVPMALPLTAISGRRVR